MQPTTALSWIARILGVGIFLLLMAFMFGGRESMSPKPNELVALLFFPGGVLLGFAIAWWREGIGATVSLVSLALFYGWIFALSGRWVTGPYFLLFATPAFLHLANAITSKLREKNNPNAG